MEDNDDDEQEEEEEEGGDDLAEEEKSGDEDSDKTSVNKEVTEPCEQVKRAVMHCMQYNALTTHSLSQIVNSALFRDQMKLIFYIISISVNFEFHQPTVH